MLFMNNLFSGCKNENYQLQNVKLRVHLKIPLSGGSSYDLSKKKKKKKKKKKEIFIFTTDSVRKISILHGRVFVMLYEASYHRAACWST